MRLLYAKMHPKSEERWDLSIKGHHNFVANGVVVHNSNCRVGIIDGQEMAGSHNHRRARPMPKRTFKTFIKRMFRMKDAVSYGAEIKNDMYWHPWSLPSVQTGLKALYSIYGDVVLYGEVYGKVQELKYGHPNDIAFAAFDIMVCGQYMDVWSFAHVCDQYNIPRVPVLYAGAYSLAKVKELSEGKTQVAGADNMREGVVVRPVVERMEHRFGRVILKYVGDEYLCSKGHNENKDV